jgi:hypothetical protein
VACLSRRLFLSLYAFIASAPNDSLEIICDVPRISYTLWDDPPEGSAFVEWRVELASLISRLQPNRDRDDPLRLVAKCDVEHGQSQVAPESSTVKCGAPTVATGIAAVGRASLLSESRMTLRGRKWRGDPRELMRGKKEVI